ncbi:NadS family protein [Corallincola platygyrae]|uniref:NadS family protein n=1 Tax=Corallincola platygyrae TaxID=1193278 RepID=A0ABW4XQS7_9GAMM
MDLFKELKASLEEAIEIQQENREASRVYRYELIDVKALRNRLGVSQLQFSTALGASLDTVKSWESRRRNPTGIAAKILFAIDKNPTIFHELALH